LSQDAPSGAPTGQDAPSGVPSGDAVAHESLEPLTPAQPAKSGSGGAFRFLRELPVLIALALCIALLIKAFLVQAFYIPSASMEPTLTRGDRVLVNKLSYRLGDPKRGDVIVFKDPYPDPCKSSNSSSDKTGCNDAFPRKALNWFAEVFGLPTGDTRDFIKRIVALPGETIAMNQGNVYVCDAPGCVPVDKNGAPKDGRLISFPHTSEEGPQKDEDTIPPFVVPDGQYFVLGDNRANSSDSRSFRGVHKDDIVGKAFVLVWPPTRFDGL
jgi:signal peptidase I